MLFSGGKDSVVHAAPRGQGVLARRRCRSRCCMSTPGHNFPEVLEFRDDTVRSTAAPRRRARAGLHRRRPARASAPTARATRCRPCRCSTRSRRTASTRVLRRRPPRRGDAPAPRSGSSACATSSASGIRATSAPSCGPSTTAGTCRASTCAYSRSPTGPSSTSGATSSREASSLPSIYYAHERVWSQRDGMWLTRRTLARARSRREQVVELTVRYRTVGDMSLHRCGAVRRGRRRGRDHARSG